jgi:hypothetical protein
VVVDSTVPEELIRSARKRNPVIGDPPVLDGGNQVAFAVIAAPATPGDAVPITGAPGTPAAGMVTFTVDAGPVPAALIAATLKV